MKRSGIIILVIVAALALWAITSWNNLGRSETAINGKWGEVEIQYQRKKAVYDGAIKTIKAAAKNEDTTLLKITQLRSKIPANINPDNPQELADANKQFDQIRSAINISVEAYPTLQAMQGYRDFQTEVTGTENRIAVAIRDWNQAITDFNSQIVTFPNNILASIFGKKAKANYKSDEGAKNTTADDLLK
jgi:LemA protein